LIVAIKTVLQKYRFFINFLNIYHVILKDNLARRSRDHCQKS